MLGLGLGLGLGGGGGPSGPVPPAGYQAAGGLWIQADRGLPAGVAVASWPDQSGNGNSPSQATGGKQPLCTAGAGPKVTLPAVVFTSASSQNLALALALVPTKNFSISIIAKATSTASIQSLVSCGSGNGQEFGVDTNGDTLRGFNAAGVLAITGGAATTAWEAWLYTSDASGNISLKVNGVTQALSAASVTSGAPAAQTNFGSRTGTTAFLNGSMFGVVIWPTALSAGGITQALAFQSAASGLF